MPELITSEFDRFKNLISELTEEEQEALFEALPAAINDVGSIWVDSIEPMRFDEFCIELDGCSLYPRQLDAFVKSDLLRASQMISPNRRIREFILLWGKGSLADGSLLRDISDGKVYTVQELYISRKSIVVQSLLNGKIVELPASPVFCKGQATTWIVRLEDGRSVTVSADHRFQTAVGWKKLRDLSPGDAVSCIPLHDVLCEKRLFSTPDSPIDCHSLFHSYGVSAPQAEDTCINEPPLQGDVLGPIPFWLPSDDCAELRKDNIPCFEDGSSEPKSYEDAYQPLVSGDGGEWSLLESGISPQVREVLDRFCNLPLPEKEQILNAFFDLEGAVGEIERECRFAAFSRQVYHILSPGALQSGAVSCLERKDEQPQPCQYSSSEISFVVITDIVPHTKTNIYDLTVPLAHNYFDADGILHHNSGKDYISSKLVAYIAYCVLHIAGDPCIYFRQFANNLAPQSELSIMNVAPDEDSAKQLFFEPWLKKWFQHPLFRPFAPKLYKDRVHFEAKNEQGAVYNKISCYSMHSRAAGLDGKNLIAWIMDEADAFMTANGVSNADKIHNILRSSANTRMNRAWFGVIITYVRDEEGFAMRMYERAKDNPGIYYYDLAATWEINPNFDRTNEDVLEMYKVDPRAAMMLYECKCIGGTTSFFEFPEKLGGSIVDRAPCASVEYHRVQRTTEQGRTIWYQGVSVSEINKVPGRVYFLGGDGGAKKDSFVCAVWSIDETSASPGWFCPKCGKYEQLRVGASYVSLRGKEEYSDTDLRNARCGMCMCTPFQFHPALGLMGWWRRSAGDMKSVSRTDRNGNARSFHLPYLRQELTIRVTPYVSADGSPSRTVDMVGVYNAAQEIIVGLGISTAGFDPWQTMQMSQQLIGETGCDVQEMGMGNAEQYRRATLCKHTLYFDLLQFMDDAVEQREWKRLQDLNNHTKVDHPKSVGGVIESKDTFDASSIAIWLACCSVNETLSADWL